MGHIEARTAVKPDIHFVPLFVPAPPDHAVGFEPKTHTEIERKWVAKHMPDAFRAFPSVHITQCYLPDTTRYRMEVRQADGRDEVTFIETKKSLVKGDIEREEEERLVTSEDFAQAIELRSGDVIYKQRYEIPDRRENGERYIIQFDELLGNLAGRFLVETEFPDKNSCRSYTLPTWFTEQCAVREVTGDKRYGNKNIARKNWPLDLEDIIFESHYNP